MRQQKSRDFGFQEGRRHTRKYEFKNLGVRSYKTMSKYSAAVA